MAQVVAVHGIGQQLKGRNTLQATWLPAMQEAWNDLTQTGSSHRRRIVLLPTVPTSMTMPRSRRSPSSAMRWRARSGASSVGITLATRVPRRRRALFYWPFIPGLVGPPGRPTA
jgi:hypothetical protein